MNILWLAEGRGAVGGYRCYVPAMSLQQERVSENDFLFHEDFSKSAFVKEMAGMDIVVFQRAVSDKSILWMKQARAEGAKIVVEMDDDLFNVPRHNPAGWYWWNKKTQRLLREQLEFCDLVIVSTRPLAARIQEAMGWRTSEKIRVCPNHLHPAMWGAQRFLDVPQHDNGGKIVIGWQGSATHERDFTTAIRGLKRTLDACPNTLLHLMGNVPRCIQGTIPEDRIRWAKGVQFAVYPGTLWHQHFDIGIAPLTDSKFNQCKSSLKYLEYAALKVPCVASKVYPYETTITNGVNGFLAENDDEWADALITLVNSEELRRAVGRAAFARVWQNHSYHTHYPLWADAFQHVLAGAPAAATV